MCPMTWLSVVYEPIPNRSIQTKFNKLISAENGWHFPSAITIVFTKSLQGQLDNHPVKSKNIKFYRPSSVPKWFCANRLTESILHSSLPGPRCEFACHITTPYSVPSLAQHRTATPCTQEPDTRGNWVCNSTCQAIADQGCRLSFPHASIHIRCRWFGSNANLPVVKITIDRHVVSGPTKLCIPTVQNNPMLMLQHALNCFLKRIKNNLSVEKT